LQPPHTGAQQDGSHTGAQQDGSHTGAQQDGSGQQDEPQLEPQQPPNLGILNFGILNFGILNFGILKQDDPQPLLQPQLSPHVLQQSTGAQQAGSQAVAQAAGAQQDASTGAQQVGSQAVAQAAGAQQVASTGAQQDGSTLHPQPLLLLKQPNNPA
jgi:hypothetical protein